MFGSARAEQSRGWRFGHLIGMVTIHASARCVVTAFNRMEASLGVVQEGSWHDKIQLWLGGNHHTRRCGDYARRAFECDEDDRKSRDVL